MRGPLELAINLGLIMNLGFDFTPYVYGKAPGYNEYAMSLLDGLSRIDLGDVKVTLFVRRDQAHHFSRYGAFFNIVAAPVESVFARLLWQNVSLNRRKDVDVIVFTGNFSPFFVRKPYVLVTHDLNFLSHPANFSSLSILFKRVVIPRSIRRAASNIVISEAVKREVYRAYRRESIVIHNPVRGAARVDQCSVFFGAGSAVKFLCLSSLAVHKNIPAAVSAAQRFLSDGKDAVFFFAGNWGVSEFPVDVSDDRIVLLGHLDSNVRDELINHVDCVLAPSVYEGFGMPYVEAMLAGKALVCSDIEIAREVVGGGAFFIRAPHDADAIYEALVEAEACGFRREVDAAALMRFDPGVAAQRYVNVARSVC